MNPYQYERPREKLQQRGARALSQVELWQLVIGSGVPGISGASVAQRVAALASDRKLSYQLLVGEKGVGVAKACQILAVAELARRMGRT